MVARILVVARSIAACSQVEHQARSRMLYLLRDSIDWVSILVILCSIRVTDDL